jgi:hypothetical protein
MIIIIFLLPSIFTRSLSLYFYLLISTLNYDHHMRSRMQMAASNQLREIVRGDCGIADAYILAACAREYILVGDIMSRFPMTRSFAHSRRGDLKTLSQTRRRGNPFGHVTLGK